MIPYPLKCDALPIKYDTLTILTRYLIDVNAVPHQRKACRCCEFPC